MSAIEHAVELAGSQTALAIKLGVSQPAVNAWIEAGHVPLKRAAQIESIYGIPAITLVDSSIANLLGRCPNCDE